MTKIYIVSPSSYFGWTFNYVKVVNVGEVLLLLLLLLWINLKCGKGKYVCFFHKRILIFFSYTSCCGYK